MIVAICILLLCTCTGVYGHGAMTKPMSHNVYHQTGPRIPVSTDFGGPGDVQNLNAGIGGGSAGEDREKTVGHSLCGDINERKAFLPVTGIFGTTPPTCTYAPGSDIDIDIQVTAYHGGWFEFRLCDLGTTPDGLLTQDCLNTHVLTFDSMDPVNEGHDAYTALSSGVRCEGDIGVPYAPRGSCCNGGGGCSDPGTNNDRWVLPSVYQNGMYNMKFKLPPGLECEDCVLQWLYQTGNSPDHYPEAFWNCATIRISSEAPATCLSEPPPGHSGADGAGQPTADPTEPDTTDPDATEPDRTGGDYGRCTAEACDSEEHCRSEYGYCGGSSFGSAYDVWCNQGSTWSRFCLGQPTSDGADDVGVPTSNSPYDAMTTTTVAAAVSPTPTPAPTQAAPQTDLATIFGDADTDGDGSLSMEEVRVFLARLGSSTEPQLRRKVAASEGGLRGANTAGLAVSATPNKASAVFLSVFVLALHHLRVGGEM